MIIETFGSPITASSCNLSSSGSNFSYKTIDKSLLNQIDLFLDCGDLPESPDFAIVDIFNIIKIRRKGKIKAHQIKEILNNQIKTSC